jgi:hypothetical protein
VRVPRAAPSSPQVPWLAVLAALLLAAPSARAGTEEVSTFSVELQEEDDESLIDHMLNRTPRAWRDEFDRSTLAIRTSQGCLTSGQWINETDLKLRTSLGGRAWFGFDLTQSESDRVSYQFTDFSFHVPTRFGTPGYMFRPFHDKSRQDMAFMWDVGDDTTAFHLRAVMGLEDVFNNFWEFRQSRVANVGFEPYEKHPWEPGLSVAWRGAKVRAELGGRYLTPSRKRHIVSQYLPQLDRISTLWGTLAWASVEGRALGITWEARGANRQARSTDFPADTLQPDGANFRRQWSAEAALHRQITPELGAEARVLYQDRTQQHAPPIDPPRFVAVDRAFQLETMWTPSTWLGLRFGALHDRITMQQSAISTSVYSWGTRTEKRLYLGVILKAGRVSLQGIEGIELDHEPYEVVGVHDKGFLQLQATF